VLRLWVGDYKGGFSVLRCFGIEQQIHFLVPCSFPPSTFPPRWSYPLPMSNLPNRFTAFVESYPEIGSAYHLLGRAVAEAGPLDAKTQAMVKLGISIGAGLEGGSHSQARKALDAGATPDELRHVVLQATTTIGFPSMMRGLSWVEDVIRATKANSSLD